MHPDSMPGSRTLPLNLRFCLDMVREIAPHGTTLDYGCGAGLAVSVGAEQGLNIYGCDVFYEGGSYRSFAQELGVLGSRVLEMSGSRIPFADATFDFIYHNQVFEHVADMDTALAELRRVLKPDGAVLSIFPMASVWREGHIGIPFAHRFQPNSRVGLAYTAAMYRLGFGYFRKDPPMQWAASGLAWIGEWCHYRHKAEIEVAYARAGLTIEPQEPAYIRWRLAVTKKPYEALVNRILKLSPQLGTFLMNRLANAVMISHPTS